MGLRKLNAGLRETMVEKKMRVREMGKKIKR
jgi:hypothetical protein